MEANFLKSTFMVNASCSKRGNCRKLPWKKDTNLCHHTIITFRSHGVPHLQYKKSTGTFIYQEEATSEKIKQDDQLLKPNGTKMMMTQEGIGIVRFLKGKNFLITGATGFVAKVFIEKILRTEPEVGNLYLLIRSKGNVTAEDRLKNEIINSELFRCVRETHGSNYEDFMLNKLVVVDGAVTDDDLGMEEAVAMELSEIVDVIVNSAANTTFDERYDVALDINTRGPYRLMKFAAKCTRLKLFLHVSTAFVNGQRKGRITEQPFKLGDSIARERFRSSSSAPLSTSNSSPSLRSSLLKLDVEAEIESALRNPVNLQDKQETQKMKEFGLEMAKTYGWQDTYAFTKAMGEMAIEIIKGDVPVVIIRPSVVESTSNEPFPGWMEGNRMMDPVILYYGKGQISCFLVNPKGVIDVVPADMVVNAMLAAMAKHGAKGKPGTHVYHVASSVTNPLIFEDLAKMLYDHFSSSPYVDYKGRKIGVPEMKLYVSWDDFSDHIWRDFMERPGNLAAKSSAKLSRRIENVLLKSVEQAKNLAKIYEPYSFYRGRFDNSNTQQLMEEMSEEERKAFGFDVVNINWKDYIINVHIPGLRSYVMKGRGTSKRP
ncbi:fatty acyl-CoA reductase 2, chloroplastic-like [Nymphaea colorata]|nr:fatty acyl-CoA reductase 2, chloroplastic-like [Nymphaea colorata]